MSEERPKVLLILEHSEDPGVPISVVRDCHGSMPMDMSACDVVGTWSKFDKGTFYVVLTTPVEALQDILVQLISKRTEDTERATYPIIHRSDLPSMSARLPRKLKPIETAPDDVPSADFGNLRAKLGK